MTSPTETIAIVSPMIDRYTFGQLREAADALGEPDLLAGVIQGDKRLCYAACRFLTRDPEDCVKCSERTDCHGTLARQVVLDGAF